MRKRFMLTLAAVAALMLFAATGSLAAAQGAGGVTGAAFYVDGVLYATVNTPTDLTGTGAPEHSFDTIYALGAYQMYNVSESGPGMPGYNGGRWRVQVVTFTNYAAALAVYDTNGSGDFDSDEEVEAAIAGGAATTADGPSFVCPVIKLSQG